MVDVDPLDVALGLLTASLAVAFLRFLKGPSLVDRLLAVETTTLIILGVIAVVSVKYSFEFFVAVLIIAILSVISSVAVAKYLVGGRPF